MEDAQIIDLYFQRDEAAITQTAAKYGIFCHKLARNILSIEEDAEECVNDTYLQAWNAIPPLRPDKLGAWLGRVVRNIAINLWNKNHRKKRYSGMELLLAELEECIPSSQTVEQKVEEKELTEAINVWLDSLSREDRILFLRRYWNGEAVKELARERGMTPERLARRMYGLRQNLKLRLEQEGYSL